MLTQQALHKPSTSQGKLPRDRAALSRFVCQSIDAQAIALLSKHSDTQVIASYAHESDLAENWLDQVVGLAKKRKANHVPTIIPLHGPDKLYGQSAPQHLILLGLSDRTPTISTVACLAGGEPSSLKRLCDQLVLAAGLIAEFELRQHQVTLQDQISRQRLASSLLAQVNQAKHFREAAMAFCNELASTFDLERVCLGIRHGPYIRLKTASATEHINRKMAYVQLIEAAMEESADQQETVIHPPSNAVDTVARAAGKLAHHVDAGAVCSMPLIKDEIVELVITVEFSPQRMPNLAVLESLKLALEHVGPTLLSRHHQDRWAGAKALAASRSLASLAVGAKHTWMKLLVIALLGLAFFLVFAKGTYRVESGFITEPTATYIVDTPFDGTIDKANVEAGDKVHEGQELAELRTADLRLELLSLAADRERFAREADLAMRENRQADRHIALARRDQAEANIERIQHDIERAVITSPIDGVIMEGDLRERIGGTTQRGELLFKLMPEGSLRGVVMVDESQINDLTIGANGWLSPASDPSLRLKATVERIAPVAQLKGSQNVFPVRVRFEDRPDWLSPGMEGIARIDVGERRYAWIWTRSAVNWIRMKMWW